ncbi:unnamed protein product [Urochloa decumbens]|uniref:Uncharacterized protein n=1 Tax=Urochloa decumbens TaxID=240449 RepID=A0ABC9BW80_9POAL
MAQVLLQAHHRLLELLRHQYPTTSSPQAAALAASVVLVVLVLVRRLAATPSTTTAREQLLSRLPSPPSRLPVIGHLHLVGSLPHVSLRDLAAKHGRRGLMLLRLGAVPTVIISSPSAAQAVLRTHDHVFASRPYSAIADIIFYGSSDIVFSPYGEYWRQLRKIATTHLLTNKKVRSYRHAREQETMLLVTKVREAAMAHTSVDLTELLNEFSNDVFCHAVSGKIFKEEGRNRLLRELGEINSALLGGFNVEDYFPVLAKLDIVKRILCAKAQDVNKRWDELLNKLIHAHESRLVSERDGEESDFIDVLLSVQQEYNLTRDSIKAQLVIMLEAGTDTSFIVLEYVMVELMRNPRVLAKLQSEVRTAIPKGKEIVTEDDLSGLTYLKAVIKETLRLHASAPLLVPHLSTADCDIDGYTIPSGTRVLINIWALARDPNYWESPEEFMPERFMEGGSAAHMDFKGNDFSYLPFGSGRRMCPGINFAMGMIEGMVTNLVYHFNWELAPELADKGIDMTESFGVTLHRNEKLLLVPVVPH